MLLTCWASQHSSQLIRNSLKSWENHSTSYGNPQKKQGRKRKGSQDRFLDDLGVIWGARDAARHPGFWPWKIFDRNKMQSKKWHGIWDQMWPKFGSRFEIFWDHLATDFQPPEENFGVNRMAFLILPAAFWNSSGHDFVKSRNTFC